MKILFTGDFFAGGDLAAFGTKGIVDSNAFESALVRVINLEQALTNIEYVESKCTLYTPKESITILKALGITHANIANNHIHDKGADGVTDTYSTLTECGICAFGAGKDAVTASLPVNIAPTLFVLGYCDYKAPTLNNILVADELTPGVNQLAVENVINDLDMLPEGAQAVVLVHWGTEHLFFPPHKNLVIARKILAHPKVITLIGMHAHRIQGTVSYSGKTAHMCLGNFLFPNFFIKPRTQLCPSPTPFPEKVRTTYAYHGVHGLTYKKWKFINRLSYCLELDSESKTCRIIPMVQNPNVPTVRELSGLRKRLVIGWIGFLSATYRIPEPVYKFLYKANEVFTYFHWRSYITVFWIRELGFLETFKSLRRKMTGTKRTK